MIVGIGVDAVDLSRLEEALARRPSMAARLFTEAERDYCERAAPAKRAERYAGRFAVKEAVMKALGVGLGAFGFHDVELSREDSGAPQLHLSGEAATLASARGVSRWFVSISHTDHVAVAMVVAESSPTDRTNVEGFARP